MVPKSLRPGPDPHSLKSIPPALFSDVGAAAAFFSLPRLLNSISMLYRLSADLAGGGDDGAADEFVCRGDTAAGTELAMASDLSLNLCSITDTAALSSPPPWSNRSTRFF